MLFDTHAHYNDERFLEDRDELLNSMQENNVGYIMNACAAMDEIPTILEIANKYSFVYASVGVHPHDVENMTEKDIEIIKEASKNDKVKAIGEIGLDYFYDLSPRDLQKKWFMRQIELATEVNLPIIIHSRDACLDTMNILKESKARDCGGVFHCFSGSVETAKEVLDMGLYIAFGGTLTFKKAQKAIEVAKYTPLDRILLETDSPYLTPEPFRGKRNSSLYVHLVAEKMAEIKGMTVSEIEEITTKNAKKCFNID